MRHIPTFVSLCLAAGVVACAPSYSPNEYDSRAVQQANKVDQGMVVGVRKIDISANGTAGAAVGGAAGGIAGSQVGGGGALSAFAALGGTLLGGLVGTSVEHVQGDTDGYEYIVRKPNGDLLSVTQKDTTPLAIGEKVLVIAGPQARVVPDYTVPVEPPKAKPPPSEAKPPTET
jgi:outer membrane lipoprotein SlyB